MGRERIVYEIREADGKMSAATFDRAQAEEWALTSGAVVPTAVPTLLTATGAWSRLDGLDRLFWGSGETAETIAYAVVTEPGGVDGRDHTARGGAVRFASTDRDTAERASDGWTRVEARVAVPAEVSRRAAAKVDPVRRLCLDEHLEELRDRTERAMARGGPAPAASRR